MTQQETVPERPLARVISIDPPLSVDLDDAVNVYGKPNGGYVVDICLPDVPSVIPPDSPADVRAKGLGFTRYGGAFIKTPMFDEGIIGRLSLVPYDRRPMIWIQLTLDSELEVVNVEIQRIVHKTRARLTYLGADEALKQKDHPFNREVTRLWDLAQKLYAKRHTRTGALFDASQGIYTTEEGVVQMLRVKETHQSHLIVMELMILTNSALALYAHARCIPILYRNHKPSDTSSGFRAAVLKELAEIHTEGFKQTTERMKQLGARIGPATLGTEPQGHWGLDLPAYAWFTSPLRRYSDVINLRALVDNVSTPNLFALGEQLTELYREERNRRGAKYADQAKLTIVRHVRAGNAMNLREYDLNLVLRACAEADIVDDFLLEELRARMSAERLSGKDIEGIFTYGRALFHESVIQEVFVWLLTNTKRQLMFARDMVQRQRIARVPVRKDGEPAIATAMGQIAELYQLELPLELKTLIEAEEPNVKPGPSSSSVHPSQGRVIEPKIVPIPHPNPKGALLELANARKAIVTYENPTKSGPDHNTNFTVEAIWRLGEVTISKQGAGPNIKHAEKLAAYYVLVELGFDTPSETSAGPSLDDESKHPKSRLLEYATIHKGVLEFTDAIMSGPSHSPLFTLTGIYRQGDKEYRSEGSGSTRKQAEKEACVEIRKQLAG